MIRNLKSIKIFRYSRFGFDCFDSVLSFWLITEIKKVAYWPSYVVVLVFNYYYRLERFSILMKSVRVGRYY